MERDFFGGSCHQIIFRHLAEMVFDIVHRQFALQGFKNPRPCCQGLLLQRPQGLSNISGFFRIVLRVIFFFQAVKVPGATALNSA